ncbi:MAG: hypothetical protein NC935_01440 [Candidatus Omnitrophica bacterium]|nr:hypothetical protein [Candidatus Omnitrophota bacterium]
MRKMIFLLIILFIPAIFSQDANYKDDIKKIYELTKELDEYIDSNRLEFDIYDKWYKEFLLLRDDFVKKYLATYSKEEFFKTARDAFDKFSLVWGFLNDFEYAKAQYAEYIGTNDIGYAHKWRETANTKKQNAIEFFKEAKNLLEKIK